MRKTIVAMTLGIILLSAGLALAETYYSFDDIYMTAGAGNTTKVETFTLDQQPYLYFRFMDAADSEIVGTVSNSTTGWIRESDPTRYVYYDQAPAQNGVWISFTPEYWQGNVTTKDGDWTVETSSLLSYKTNLGTLKQDRYVGCTTFKIVPEPLSAVLFLFGAGSLAFATRRKSKKL